MAQDILIEIMFGYKIDRINSDEEAVDAKDSYQMLISIKIPEAAVNGDGYPHPIALWGAEKRFLEIFEQRHSPNERLIAWQTKLIGDKLIMSEYKCLFDPKFPL